MVSEAAHRAGYDLTNWQSIAKLLSDARAKLSTDEYPAFYNAVTTFSRSRGSDEASLEVINTVLTRWEPGVSTASEAVVQNVPVPVPPEEPENDVAADAVLAAAMHSAPTKEVVAVHAVENAPSVQGKISSQPFETTAVPQKIMTVDEAKARILIIKNEIHELIGNPVALIGDMGSLGKVYMTALVTASRATMGGAGGRLMPAMQSLEEAYEKLRIAAATGNVPQKDMAPAQEKEETVEIPELVPQKEEPEREVESESVVSDVPMPTPSLPEPVSETVTESLEEIVEQVPPAVAEIVPMQIPHAEEKEEASVTSDEEPQKPVFKEEVVSKEESAAVPEVAVREEPVAVTPSVPLPQREETSQEHDEIEMLRKQLASLEAKLHKQDTYEAPAREEEKVEKKEVHMQAIAEKSDVVHTTMPMLEPEKVPSVEVSHKQADAPTVPKKIVMPLPPSERVVPDKKVQGMRVATFAPPAVFSTDRAQKEDMYQTEAVTDGLRSLLMSWEIFRGGFLSGKERGIGHPLYITMRDVLMSDILAGKFPGAKTQTVISVNDYVNAWRYEQGIEFNRLETFEHYLRRIIHRILTRAGEI